MRQHSGASFLTDPCLRPPLKLGICVPALSKQPGQQIESLNCLNMNISLISQSVCLISRTCECSVKKVTLDSFYQLSSVLGQNQFPSEYCRCNGFAYCTVVWKTEPTHHMGYFWWCSLPNAPRLRPSLALRSVPLHINQVQNETTHATCIYSTIFSSVMRIEKGTQHHTHLF